MPLTIIVLTTKHESSDSVTLSATDESIIVDESLHDHLQTMMDKMFPNATPAMKTLLASQRKALKRTHVRAMGPLYYKYLPKYVGPEAKKL